MIHLSHCTFFSMQGSSLVCPPTIAGKGTLDQICAGMRVLALS